MNRFITLLEKVNFWFLPYQGTLITFTEFIGNFIHIKYILMTVPPPLQSASHHLQFHPIIPFQTLWSPFCFEWQSWTRIICVTISFELFNWARLKVLRISGSWVLRSKQNNCITHHYLYIHTNDILMINYGDTRQIRPSRSGVFL